MCHLAYTQATFLRLPGLATSLIDSASMSDSPTPLMTTFGPTQRPQASRGDVWLPQSTAVDSALTTSSHLPSRIGECCVSHCGMITYIE